SALQPAASSPMPMKRRPPRAAPVEEASAPARRSMSPNSPSSETFIPVDYSERSWARIRRSGVVRIAIVSDIHATLPAFEAVLRHAEGGGHVEALWCLGDTVGCGPHPNECPAVL